MVGGGRGGGVVGGMKGRGEEERGEGLKEERNEGVGRTVRHKRQQVSDSGPPPVRLHQDAVCGRDRELRPHTRGTRHPGL